MEKRGLHRIPHRDPVNGGDLVVSELTGLQSGITIRGEFEIPKYAKLDDEQAEFLEIFLRCRGMMNGVERELGISYPTARAKFDALLAALDIVPLEVKPGREKVPEERKAILDQLEKGEISADEAKRKLGVGK